MAEDTKRTWSQWHAHSKQQQEKEEQRRRRMV